MVPQAIPSHVSAAVTIHVQGIPTQKDVAETDYALIPLIPSIITMDESS